jgi:hypothetical protein
MALTSQQELDLVDQALVDLYADNTQEYGSKDRHRRALDLKALLDRKTALQWQVAREAGGGVFAGQFRNPE